MDPSVEVVSTPDGFVDYVARFVHPRIRMRTQVFRATSEADAVAYAMANLAAPGLSGWTLLDIMTRDEAMARRGGAHG